MTSKYVMTSNMCYDENKCMIMSKVCHSERGSAISDCLVMMCVIASEGLPSLIVLL